LLQEQRTAARLSWLLAGRGSPGLEWPASGDLKADLGDIPLVTDPTKVHALYRADQQRDRPAAGFLLVRLVSDFYGFLRVLGSFGFSYAVVGSGEQRSSNDVAAPVKGATGKSLTYRQAG
jgi:hypothetical protein